MIIVYGWDTQIKSEKFLGKKKCENCDSISDVYLTREIFRIKLFGIPVLWWTQKRAIMCSNCGMIKKLKKAEYEEIKNNPGMIYNHIETANDSSEGITNWRENITASNTELNYDGTKKEKVDNNSSNVGLILLRLILTPIFTLVFWFLYLFIVALFIPVEAEITDTQGWTCALLALITALIIVLKIKPNKK